MSQRKLFGEKKKSHARFHYCLGSREKDRKGRQLSLLNSVFYHMHSQTQLEGFNQWIHERGNNFGLGKEIKVSTYYFIQINEKNQIIKIYIMIPFLPLIS